jgi:heptaprenyl diphosphate synthase
MKRFEQFRIRRQKVYEGLFSARALCIAGLLAMPALLFNPIPLFRVAQFLLFWFLCWLAGKKNNPLITILVIVGIVAFNLIVPYGRVLYSFGQFRITLGALMTGIQRAVTLEGLIMLSRLTIRRDLKIPGAFGELIGESFRYFAQIMDSKKRITRKNLVGDIDQLMIELSEGKTPGAGESQSQAEAPAARTKAAGFIILALVVILAWIPLVPLILIRLFLQ